MVRYVLLHTPGVVLGVGFVALSTALGILGLYLVRKSVALSTLESHNDVAGFIIAVIGVVYAVLLAFVAVAVWEQFNDAKAIADQEAVIVEQLYRDADVLGQGASQLRDDVRAYAQSVIDDEWDAMAKGRGESRQTDAALADLWRTFRRSTGATPLDTSFLRPPGAEVFDADFLRRLDDLDAARRSRTLAATNSLPLPLWSTLLFGAVITVAFTYFFGVTRFAAQALMVAALSATVGLILYLIIALNHPFSGSLSVKPDAMREAVVEFEHLGP